MDYTKFGSILLDKKLIEKINDLKKTVDRDRKHPTGKETHGEVIDMLINHFLETKKLEK